MIGDLEKLQEEIFSLKDWIQDLDPNRQSKIIDRCSLKDSIKELKEKVLSENLEWIEPTLHLKKSNNFATFAGKHAEIELFITYDSCWSIFKLHKSLPGMDNLSSDLLEQYKMYLYANEMLSK